MVIRIPSASSASRGVTQFFNATTSVVCLDLATVTILLRRERMKLADWRDYDPLPPSLANDQLCARRHQVVGRTERDNTDQSSTTFSMTDLENS